MWPRFYPPANDIGVDPVPHRNSGYGNSRLLALLDDLGLEGFRVGVRWRIVILALRAIASA